MRKQRITLEHIADAARLRRNVDARDAVEEDAAIHHDATRAGSDQSRETLQRERLARAGRAEEHGDAASCRPGDVEIESRHAQRQRNLEAIAHVALEPRRFAEIITTTNSADSMPK